MAFHTSEEIIPVCQGVNLSSFDFKHFSIQDEGVIYLIPVWKSGF